MSTTTPPSTTNKNMPTSAMFAITADTSLCVHSELAKRCTISRRRASRVEALPAGLGSSVSKAIMKVKHSSARSSRAPADITSGSLSTVRRRGCDCASVGIAGGGVGGKKRTKKKGVGRRVQDNDKTDRKTGMHAGRWVGRQADRQTDKQTAFVLGPRFCRSFEFEYMCSCCQLFPCRVSKFREMK